MYRPQISHQQHNAPTSHLYLVSCCFSYSSYILWHYVPPMPSVQGIQAHKIRHRQVKDRFHQASSFLFPVVVL